MTERILMPLDGSTTGESAISYISELISKMSPQEQVEIILLHVIRNRHSIQLKGSVGMVSVPYNNEELDRIKIEAEKYLASVGKRFNQLQQQPDISTIVSASEIPAEEIIRISQETKADLVAMSTHGRGGFSRFAIGSVADKVMRGGHVPVLMVRAPEEG